VRFVAIRVATGWHACQYWDMKNTILIVSALALASASSQAWSDDDPVSSITVKGVKNPEMRSYRSLVAGMDAFEQNHALAPAVPELRYRVTVKRRKAGADMENLTLRIAGKEDSIAVPLAPDHSFSLPRSQAALEEDADLVLNRKKGTFSGTVEVRTPGLPERTVRLGDLRLECQVTVAIIKSGFNFLARAAINTAMTGSDWCNVKHAQFWQGIPGDPDDATLESATIFAGNRSANLKVEEGSFLPPLSDQSWPDDALIELKTGSQDNAGAPPGTNLPITIADNKPIADNKRGEQKR
jgi:hypothetical protein